MVPFIWTPSALPNYYAIRATWGKRCHITKFFIDPIIGDNVVGFYNMTDENEAMRAALEANMSLPDDVVVLHSMKRPWHTCSVDENRENNKPIGNCRNIWEKIWRAWVYVVYGTGGSHVNGAGQNANGKTDVENAEWFVKVDADTYLFPDNLPRYVESKGWSYNDQHYFGHKLNHRQGDRKVSIIAGAAVFFSRATLVEAGRTFNTMSMERGDEEEDGTCRDAYTGTEEVVTAVCIKDYARAEAATDADGREQISLYEVELILEYNRTEQGEWWYWQGKERVPCHNNPYDCISHLPLAFHHNKDPKDLLDLDNEFYNDDPTKRKRRKGYVNAYFDKVRATMNAAQTAESVAQGDTHVLIEHSSNTKVAGKQSSIYQSSSSNKNRLYCMVPFIWTPGYLPQYHAIRATWGKRCDVLKFYIDPIIGDSNAGFQDVRVNEKADLPDDVIVVNDIKRPWNACTQQDGDEVKTCRNIWEKLWRSWRWMDDHGELDQAEWFTKVDADTYLFPEHLKRYVVEKSWLPSEHHYFGHVLRHRIQKSDAGASIVAGAAVFFSRTTLKSLAGILKDFEDGETRSAPQECKDDYTSEEEVVTAVCLKTHFGVEAQTTLDENGKELVAVAEPEDSLLWNRTEQGDCHTDKIGICNSHPLLLSRASINSLIMSGEWWYWENKPKVDPVTGAEIHQCCGDLPIAFHGYKDPQWFYLLENEFHGSSYKVKDEDSWKYKWRNPITTKAYFDRVRKAMKKTE
eukprot:CCRYP_019637-RA/>CCRYP_019637-RA protein AED:0.01 eAED:0.01 QI:509/1/1/1/1/1/2/1575/743